MEWKFLYESVFLLLFMINGCGAGPVWTRDDPRDVVNGGHVTPFTVDRKQFRKRYRERYRKRFQLYKYAGTRPDSITTR